jgi:hypothetical protein
MTLRNANSANRKVKMPHFSFLFLSTAAPSALPANRKSNVLKKIIIQERMSSRIPATISSLSLIGVIINYSLRLNDRAQGRGL